MALHTSADAPITCAYWDELCDEDGFLALGRNRYHCSYVIYTDGTYFYAENGTTGNLDFGGPNNQGGVSGTNASSVIQAAVDAKMGGGIFVIKAGTYPLNSTINYYSNQQFLGEGMALTRFTVDTDISAFAPPDTTTNRNYALFQDFLLQLEDTSTTNPALDLTRFSYSRVRRVAIWSNNAINLWDEGILFRTIALAGQCYYNLVEGVNVGRVTNYGIRFQGIAGSRVNLNWVKFSRVGSGSPAAISVFYDYADYGHVENSSVGGALTGIQVDNVNMTEIDRLFFEGTTGTCIDITANAQYTMLRRNSLYLPAATLISDLGTGTQYDHNLNYITENSGSGAIIAAAVTSVVVAHGCDYTPAAADISVTLTNQPTNDIGDVYLSAIGAANFTINCRNVPGVATAIFSWTVRRV